MDSENEVQNAEYSDDDVAEYKESIMSTPAGRDSYTRGSLVAHAHIQPNELEAVIDINADNDEEETNKPYETSSPVDPSIPVDESHMTTLPVEALDSQTHQANETSQQQEPKISQSQKIEDAASESHQVNEGQSQENLESQPVDSQIEHNEAATEQQEEVVSNNERAVQSQLPINSETNNERQEVQSTENASIVPNYTPVESVSQSVTDDSQPITGPTQNGTDHTQNVIDHTQQVIDHTQPINDHTQPINDYTQQITEPTQQITNQTGLSEQVPTPSQYYSQQSAFQTYNPQSNIDGESSHHGAVEATQSEVTESSQQYSQIPYNEIQSEVLTEHPIYCQQTNSHAEPTEQNMQSASEYQTQQQNLTYNGDSSSQPDPQYSLDKNQTEFIPGLQSKVNSHYSRIEVSEDASQPNEQTIVANQQYTHSQEVQNHKATDESHVYQSESQLDQHNVQYDPVQASPEESHLQEQATYQPIETTHQQIESSYHSTEVQPQNHQYSDLGQASQNQTHLTTVSTENMAQFEQTQVESQGVVQASHNSHEYKQERPQVSIGSFDRTYKYHEEHTESNNGQAYRIAATESGQTDQVRALKTSLNPIQSYQIESLDTNTEKTKQFLEEKSSNLMPSQAGSNFEPHVSRNNSFEQTPDEQIERANSVVADEVDSQRAPIGAYVPQGQKEQRSGSSLLNPAPGEEIMNKSFRERPTREQAIVHKQTCKCEIM